MLSKLYYISPEIIKKILVFSFKTLRRFLYLFGINKFSCKNDESFDNFQQNRRYGPLKHFCFAPYSSMFFSLHGKMSPCYATYNDKSDVYGEKTIRDSWFNGSFSKIRKEHSICNYTESCKFCMDLFQNKAYSSMLMQKYEHYAFSKTEYPKIMEFELSNRCNLECIMCDSNLSSSINKRENNSSIVTDKYDASFIEELKEFIPHLQIAEFTGGDPFLIEIYYQIWDMIIEINPKCAILITTNANCMNDRIQSLLRKSNKISFNISFDAFTKSTYEAIRKNGNFEKALTNIDIFNTYCKKNKTSINLMVCPMTVNRYELPKIVEYGNKIGAGVYFHTVIKPKELSLKFQAPEILDELIDTLKTYYFPKDTSLQKINNDNYNNLIQLIESWKNTSDVTQEELNKKKHPFETINEILKKSSNENNMIKAQKVISYFQEKNQIDELYEVFSDSNVNSLLEMILTMNFDELVCFFEKKLK